MESISANARQGQAPPDSARLDRARVVIDQTRAETNFRVFVGSEDETAGVHLHHTQGRERIRMVVESVDRPWIVFLDVDGDVVRRITAEQ